MIEIVAVTSAADAKVAKIQFALTDAAFDPAAERAAFRVHRLLVAATPKRWTGNTRKAWRIDKPEPGSRIVHNRSKAFLYMEGGTGSAGSETSHGGYIYPKTKARLYLPLVSRAMIWRPGLKFGIDYVLAKRVRGIKAMKIAEGMVPKADEILREEMRGFINRILK